MSLLFLSIDKSDYETMRILDEVRKMGISYKFFTQKDIFYSSSGIFYQHSPINFSVFQKALLRVQRYKTSQGIFSFEDENFLFKKLLQKNSIPFVNENIFKKYPLYNKFIQSQIFSEHGIPTPKTFYFYKNDPDAIERLLQKTSLDFPIVIKSVVGSRGTSVFLFQNISELKKFLASEQSSNFLFQEYLPNTCDYRILVIGGSSLGILRRSGTTDWRNNFSLGAKISKEKNKEMESFAESVCNKIGFDCAGIDIIQKQDGSFSVLEINSIPNFQGFEKALSINFSKKLLETTLELGPSTPLPC